MQSPPLVRSESGLGVIQEDGTAAAVSDGGQHITVSLLPSLCIQELCHADPPLNAIIELIFLLFAVVYICIQS